MRHIGKTVLGCRDPVRVGWILLSERPLLLRHPPMKFLFLVLHVLLTLIHEWEDGLCNIQVNASPLLEGHSLVEAFPEEGMAETVVGIILGHVHHLDQVLRLQIREELDQFFLVDRHSKWLDFVEGLNIENLTNHAGCLHDE